MDNHPCTFREALIQRMYRFPHLIDPVNEVRPLLSIPQLLLHKLDGFVSAKNLHLSSLLTAFFRDHSRGLTELHCFLRVPKRERQAPWLAVLGGIRDPRASTYLPIVSMRAEI